MLDVKSVALDTAEISVRWEFQAVVFCSVRLTRASPRACFIHSLWISTISFYPNVSHTVQHSHRFRDARTLFIHARRIIPCSSSTAGVSQRATTKPTFSWCTLLRAKTIHHIEMKCNFVFVKNVFVTDLEFDYVSRHFSRRRAKMMPHTAY